VFTKVSDAERESLRTDGFQKFVTYIQGIGQVKSITIARRQNLTDKVLLIVVAMICHSSQSKHIVQCIFHRTVTINNRPFILILQLPARNIQPLLIWSKSLLITNLEIQHAHCLQVFHVQIHFAEDFVDFVCLI
jgi:hypothetical protein